MHLTESQFVSNQADPNYLLSEPSYPVVNNHKNQFPPLRPFPPTQIHEWKGFTMKYPTCGRGLFSSKSAQQSSKSGADDLPLLEPCGFLEDHQNLQIGTGKPDSSLLGSVGHTTDIPSVNTDATDSPSVGKCSYGESTATTRENALGVSESQSPSPLDWLFNPNKSKHLSDRVMARLIQAEAHEGNPHFRDDYRQSFITLTLASRGNTMPFVVASFQMYGVHPDKVFAAITEKRRAKLGDEYSDWYDSKGNLQPQLTLASPPDTHTKASQAGAVPPSSRCQTAPVPFPEKRRA